MTPSPGRSYPILISVILVGLVALALGTQPIKPIMSNWPAALNIAAPDVLALPTAAPPAAISGAALITGVAQAQGEGETALEVYMAQSDVQEDVGEGQVRFTRRDVAGGALELLVLRLDEHTNIRVINADGATPGSDERGDTTWTDGQRHLRTVQEMTTAPYALRENSELLGAIAFGFHGEPRTANEGTVVIDGQVLRSNPGRATLCITHERRAEIGRFSSEDLARCAQAIGGGPVLLWDTLIANPDVATAEGEFLPFNPLGEDFVQLDWRKKIYNGRYPKTAAGIGLLESGESFLVLATSYDMTGIDLARQLRDMGCYAALGGDDDTSTQTVWRGQLTRARDVRPVPAAIGVYVRTQ
ncbi:MAG: phosphodiester glycosidase family protein [Roseiflexaceae bacterium]|nr:phosphodiester glycosidase family protein [Roseiflexaceae bacterium]